jgi:hypothetical protein
MAWTYLAVSADSLRHFPPGSDQLPTASVTSTAKESWPAVRWSISYPGLQFGTMCGLWTEQHSRVWTSSMADSPAKTSALQGFNEAWKASEAGFFSRLSDLPRSAARRLCSSRTYGHYLLGRLMPSEMRLSNVGTHAGTGISQPRMSELFKGAVDGSSLLPTLSASSYGYNKGGAAGRQGRARPSLQTMAKQGLLPTLTVKGNYNKAGLSSRSGDGLVTWLWKRGQRGPLNPVWAELFMGYLPQWTVCEPWAMPSSPRKRAKRSAG